MADLLVIGHVTRDLIGDGARLGGAATYVGMAAARLGMSVRVVTAAPATFMLMEPLQREPRVSIERQASRTVTTFSLDYSGPVRKVHLVETATPLVKPAEGAPFVYLAPVMGEVPFEAMQWFPGSTLVVGLQGWLRGVSGSGQVIPSDPPPAPSFASATAVCFSEHDHPRAEELATNLARHVPIVVVTRGSRGATLYDANGSYRVPASPAKETDPTGAGDVFAGALTAALWHGSSPMDAAREAAYAAARAVEGPGLGNLR